MSCAGRGIVLRQIDRLFRDGALGDLGDSQLLERYLSCRDEAAFEALVELHGPMVLGLCRRMLRDPRDIEDAFQATFLVLVRKAPAIRDRGLLSSWLYGVASRVARRARAQALRRRSREGALAEREVVAVEEAGARRDVDPGLDQELTRLPEKYRAPLVLCYLRGRTHDQAAAELRCPVGTVRSRLARGRDLLRQRLTRRGLAPTAAILGPPPTLPIRLLTANVPSSLVAPTVKAALGFVASPIIPAGASAASVLALAQGVLTTMKLAQLQWIGLTILATSLSAGGVVAVSYAASQAPATATATEPGTNSASITFPDPQEKANPEVRKPRTQLLGNLRSDRFEALEQKVDELLRRFGASPTTPTLTPKSPPEPGPPTDSAEKRPSAAERLYKKVVTTTGPEEPIRSIPAPDRSSLDSRRTPSPATNPTRELEVQLKLALEEYDRTETLFQRGAISLNEREQARSKALLTAAQLEGLDEDFKDEIDRLKLEMRRKNAERQKAEAQKEVAMSVVARNRRLNERKPGLVDESSVAMAEGELKVADAMVAVSEAELAEVGLRIQQLQRRHDRIERVIGLAERARAATPARPAP